MNEEIKVIDENEIEEVVMDNEEYPETSGGGILGVLALVGVAAGGAIGGLIYKNRNKFEERKIKKLEKKGYIITKPEPVEDVEPEDYSDDENE